MDTDRQPQGGMAGRLPCAYIAADHFMPNNKKPLQFSAGVVCLKLDDDLLSHGETPHYHRRCIVSRLSSEWDQVVPTLYGRQAIRSGCRVGRLAFSPSPVRLCDVVSGVRFNEFSVYFVCCLFLLACNTRLFGCYMVKPHGPLVLVSSTPHNAYTPSLSTL